MTIQHWIKGNNSTLSCISRWPSNKNPAMGVILFSGFSQPACDIDYYMSKLSKELVACDMYTLQVDLRGHGDSSGLLSDVTLSTIRNDLCDAIHYIKKIFNNNIICIGRGLTATILAEKATEENILGICGITPYALDYRMVHTMWLSIKDKFYEIQDIYQGKDYVNQRDFDPEKVFFFNSLGGDCINLHGQVINGKLIKELCEYDTYPVLSKCHNSIWLIPSESNKNKVSVYKFDETNKYLPCKDNRFMLYRNPKLYYHSYQCIINWINTTINL